MRLLDWWYWQDRLGWRVVEWSGCDKRRCRTCERVPIRREPRWWNLYGKNLVRRWEKTQR